MRPAAWLRSAILMTAFGLALMHVTSSNALAHQDTPEAISEFLEFHCRDCHANGESEGGFDLDLLSFELADESTFAQWVRLFDKVEQREMPPGGIDALPDAERGSFVQDLQERLSDAHMQTKGTVLRRLNRREYHNSLNDLMGTHLDIENMLPVDGRSHEFDVIGDSLGISLVHMERYLEAIDDVLDAAIAQTVERPEPTITSSNYRETNEGERFIGKVWKELEDGAVVRFSGGGYPTGMMRGTGVRQSGRYRVRVTGYAYQSEAPISFSVEGTSFARGSEKPIYGFWSFLPGEPGKTSSIEFEVWIERNYMIAIEPYGISDPQRYQRDSIEGYDGPGLAILEVQMEGPLIDEFPSPGHQLIFDGMERREIPPRNPQDRNRSWYKPQFEIITTHEDENVKQSLHRVAGEAFRRPVNDDVLEPYFALYRQQRDNGGSVEEALRVAVTAIFCSPRFLYFDEGTGRLDDHEVATRLAYFLTRTSPDDELRRRASAGQLTDGSEVLRSETERLMRDPKFDRFIVDFCDAWLDLREMDFTVPDSTLFPEYDSFLRYSMPRETHLFVRELIDQNLGVVNLVKSDFSMLNSRLAEHYDVPGVQGEEIRRVSLDEESRRGGVITQASVMKVTANGTNTSPVRRGVFVMERILGQHTTPPPPGIPGVEPDIRGAETIRDLLARHRDSPDCMSCHQQIDPPGFALEIFNPIGGVRDRYRVLGEGERVDVQVNGRNVRYRLGPDVDTSCQSPDGQRFADFAEYRNYLATQEHQLAVALTTKLATFATGREMGFSDRHEINRIVSAAEPHGYRVRDLIHLVVQSDLFLSNGGGE